MQEVFIQCLQMLECFEEKCYIFQKYVTNIWIELLIFTKEAIKIQISHRIVIFILEKFIMQEVFVQCLQMLACFEDFFYTFQNMLLMFG